MTEYRKVYAYHEKNDGMYELKSYWTSSETTQFESGENLEEYRSTTENNINLKADRIEYDLDAGMLYLYSDETKIDEIPFRVSIKPKINLGDIDDLQITQDNSAIKLSWDDPIDIEFSGLKIVEWAGTKVVRKEGSCPDSIEDGTLVIDNKTRNAYSSTPYSDSGLTNGVEYYYRFFPYDTEGNIIGDTCGEIIRVITLVPIEIPTVTGTYTYTGDTITPTFVNYDSEKMTRSGANSAKNAGTYTVTFTPKEGYMWVDTTVEAKEVTWTINPATISVVPSQSGTLTYNEQSQSPTWSNYNSDQLTISGDTNGTNAGSYTATFTPKANYVWNDGSVSKNAAWSIGKANGYVVLSKYSLEISQGQSDTITILSSSNTCTVSTTDSQYINVSLLENEITCVSLSTGNASFSINIAASNNYDSYITTVSVTITAPSQTMYLFNGAYPNTGLASYKLINDNWIAINDLPETIYSPPIVYDDVVHIIPSSKKHYVYNGFQWNQLSDSPPIAVRQGKGSMFVYDNKMCIFSGGNNNLYVWNGTLWTTKSGFFSFNRYSPNTDVQAIEYNNKLYVFNYNSSQASRVDVRTGDINSGTWNTWYLPVSLYGGFKVLIYENKIHILFNGAHYTYDGTTVETLSSLPSESNWYETNAVVYNDKIYAVPYNDNAFFYSYDSNNGWSKTNLQIPPNYTKLFSYYGGMLTYNE